LQSRPCGKRSKQLRKIEPGNATYHLNAGLLHVRLERLGVAEQALRKAVELAPKETRALRSLTRVLMENRKLAEATTLAQELLELEPTAKNYSVLAEVCHRKGDLAGARAALSRAAELNPGDSEYKRVRRLVEKGE
jgi:Flp pilus assembly protein TadD